MSLAPLEPADDFVRPGYAVAGRTGTAGVTRLPGPHGRGVPLAPVQGILALEIDPYPSLPRTPDLCLVAGGPPELRPWVARFVQAVIEVTCGDRGPQQLLRCTTRSVHQELVERCAVLNAVGRGDQRRSRLRPQLRSVHVQQPSPVSAEVSAHIRHGARSRAIAARIELVEGRWLCVALEFG